MHEKRKTSFWVKQKSLLVLKLWSSIDKRRCIPGRCASGHAEQLQLPMASRSRVEVGRMQPSNKSQPSLPHPRVIWRVPLFRKTQAVTTHLTKKSQRAWQGDGEVMPHFCLHSKGTWCPGSGLSGALHGSGQVGELWRRVPGFLKPRRASVQLGGRFLTSLSLSFLIREMW